MYLYIELWKARDSWKNLSDDERRKLVDELLFEASNHPITGVVPVSVKKIGDVTLFDGVAEEPAIIDDAVARPTGYRYVSAYMIPTLDLIHKFEERVEKLSWWFVHFDQVNAWGRMDSKAVLGDMMQPAGPPASLEGSYPGQDLDGSEAARCLQGVRAGEERGQFCWCPPGRFKMGLQQIDVTLSKGFWMGKYIVTQAQFEQVMGYNPSGFIGPALPVESVGKNEVDSYCQRLTSIERSAGRLPRGWEYRLPTEAQWEYACRAGTTTAYSFGDDASLVGEYAWYRDNSGNMTHPVGRKKPNPWNLFDMHGNCLEFCRDAYVETLPGGVDPEVTKEDRPHRTDRSDTPFWVSRGGGWFFEAAGLQTALRSRLGPRDQGYLLSFRTALVQTE